MKNNLSYGKFTTGPWEENHRLINIFIRIFTFWIPKANPDFEKKFRNVNFFWLEIDNNNHVLREIGFSHAGEPLTAAPLGDNWGIFTDLNSAPEPLEDEITPEEFDRFFLQVGDTQK